MDTVEQTGHGTLIDTTKSVVFGPNKTPHHTNKGRWLNRDTRGAKELNAVHCLGMLLQKIRDGHGVTSQDFVTLAHIFGHHITNASAKSGFGHWRQQPGEQCLIFNKKGHLIGGTFAPRPDYLAFTYGTGPKRWKRKGMNKKVKLVINTALKDPKVKSVITPYNPTRYTR